MKSVLFVGPDYHEKTGSSLFMLELLREQFLVEYVSINLIKGDNRFVLDDYTSRCFDFLICWQVMLPSSSLKLLCYHQGIFFPMYDGCPSISKVEKWLPYRSFNIISFCRKLHEDLLRIGLSSHYIQYFPEVPSSVELGDVGKIFFWNRQLEINVPLIERLFSNCKIHSLHWHQSMDVPGLPVPPLDCNNWEIHTSDWYEDKREMLLDVQKAAYYIAPRMREGIGMSFLEAMVAGRCVVAPDEPTMNEYITHGWNGLLYDPRKPLALEQHDVHAIQEKCRQYCFSGRNSWELNKGRIYEWIEEVPKINKYRLSFWFIIRFLRNPLKALRAII